MNEYLNDLKNELKRVDHLIYVSLKYTRTVDVLMNTIERMISSFDAGFFGLIEQVKKRRKNLEMPIQPLKKCQLIKEVFKDDPKMIDFVDFYLLLRNIKNSKYTKREEFRRHVTMITDIKMTEDIKQIFRLVEDEENPITETIEINIDILYEFYERLKEFYSYLEGKLKT